MLPQFPLPSWLDGFSSAVLVMASVGWATSTALVVVGAVALVRELARRRRVALADAVGRPLVDAVPTDPLAEDRRPGPARDR